MASKDIENLLFASEHKQYGDKYTEHLLEQYKLYVNSAEKISDRRQKTNEFFLALNTALVALLGFLATKIGVGTAWLLILLSFAGITLCYLWYRIILSYKGLNSGKFALIHAIEARLPLPLYDVEWEVLGRGTRKDLYEPFTHIELRVPWIFVGMYFLLFLAVVPWTSLLAFVTAIFAH